MESFSEILHGFFQRKDSIFSLLLVVGVAVAVLGEAWRLRRRAPQRKSAASGGLSADDARLEFLWTVVPLFVLVCLASVPLAKSRRASKAAVQRSVPSAQGARSLEPASFRLPPK